MGCWLGQKKIILGTSDAWSMRQLSQQPSILATQCTYCIEDCRIFGATWGHLVLFHELSFFFHCNPILVQMCILLLVKELAGLIIQWLWLCCCPCASFWVLSLSFLTSLEKQDETREAQRITLASVSNYFLLLIHDENMLNMLRQPNCSVWPKPGSGLRNRNQY